MQHGRRWRSLHGENELGRHESVEAAIQALRDDWPQARLPEDLGAWRYLPAQALKHARAVGMPVLRWQWMM